MAPCNWDVDPEGICSGWAGYSDQVKDAAIEMAVGFLWGATGRRFGVCPVTVRPGQQRFIAAEAYLAYPIWPGQQPVVAGPYLFGGTWYNLPSGCSSACCGSSGCAIVLRGPVATIEEVQIGDEVIPASAYRVDVTGGAWLLVRTDGGCWPGCQNMTANEGDEGFFSVTYGAGRVPPNMLLIAAALLACEYGKFFTSGSCGLPAKMTQLTRQGVTVEIEPPDPDEGRTGIKLVDDIISTLNPGKRQGPPIVLSPDQVEGCDRVTMIYPGS